MTAHHTRTLTLPAPLVTLLSAAARARVTGGASHCDFPGG